MTHWRWVKGAVPGAAALLATGCGGWVEVDTAKDHGGSSGGSTGGSSGVHGAPTPTDASYEFYVIPGLLGPNEDATQFHNLAREVSENGALVVGTTSEAFQDGEPNPIGPQAYSGNSRYFYWTPEAETQPWDRGDTSLCLSGDGSAIFTYSGIGGLDGHTPLGFTRWTPEGGFETIGDEATYVGSNIQMCSYDGKRFGGSVYGSEYGGQKSATAVGAVLWAADQRDGLVSPPGVSEEIPNSNVAWVSATGSVSFVFSGDSPTHIYRGEGDATPILLPFPEENCVAQPASRDGNVVLATCGDSTVHPPVPNPDETRLYRWTAETQSFAGLGSFEPGEYYTETSPDGSASLTTFDSQLVYIKGSTTVLIEPKDQLSVVGLSTDGSSAYLHISGATPVAARWTEAEGVVPLESLPNLPCTELSYPKWTPRFEGSLAVGRSHGCQAADSRAVLWDSLGVRDIATELQAAGADLQGVRLRSADRLLSGTRIRIMGTGELANGAVRTWIAQLPSRE